MDGIRVLYRDEHVLVADKPAGLLSVGDDARERSLPLLLREQEIQATPVHRLDRDVSGAIVLALSAEARRGLEELFEEREVHKVYWALASGRIERAEGKFSFPILEERGGARVSARGKPATTRYRVIARFPGASELEVEPVTGRKNQIRVHFAHAGFPLVGERKYRTWLLYLHSSSVGFEQNSINLHQVLVAKAEPGVRAVPTTREEIYLSELRTPLRRATG